MDEQFEKILLEIANGDEECYNFMDTWNKYTHAIDGTIDKDPDAVSVQDLVISAHQIFSSNYYRKNANYLYDLIMVIYAKYFTSVEYEKSGVEWKHQEANYTRSCGNDLLIAIANIQHKSDFNKVLSITKKLSEASYQAQRK